MQTLFFGRTCLVVVVHRYRLTYSKLLTGQVYPEDAGALRAAHMDAYAAEADQQREAIIDRAREATRAREKAIYEQQVQRSNEFRSMGLLGRMAASPVSERAAAQARAAWGISE